MYELLEKLREYYWETFGSWQQRVAIAQAFASFSDKYQEWYNSPYNP